MRVIWDSWHNPPRIVGQEQAGHLQWHKCQIKYLLVIFTCLLSYFLPTCACLSADYLLTIDVISIRQLLARHCAVIGFTTAWHHGYLLDLFIAIPWYSLLTSHWLRYNLHWLIVIYWDWWLVNENFTSFQASIGLMGQGCRSRRIPPTSWALVRFMSMPVHWCDL